MDKNGTAQANGHANGHANGKQHIRLSLPQRIVVEEATAKQAQPSRGTAPLTKERKRRVLKPRAGASAHVEPMFDLYAANQKELGSSIDIASLRVELAGDAARAAEEKALYERWRAIADARLALQGEVWEALLEIYKKALASPSLRSDPSVRDFVAFMKQGPRKAVAK